MPKPKQPKPIIISERDFYGNYKPIINHIVRANTDQNIKDEDITPWCGCAYETYGAEVAHIVALARNPKTAKRIWTLIDGDDDQQHVVAGFRLVNRQGYFITQKSWKTGTEEIELD